MKVIHEGAMMYYSKQSNVNNDYYNVYDYSDEEKRKENILNTIIKILAIILLLTFIIFGYIFMLKEHQSEQTLVKKTILTPETINEPTSVTSTKDTSSVNSQEILTIVHLVMEQMNQEMAKKEKQVSIATSLEGDDDYAKVLMSQEIDEIKSTMNSTEASAINIEKVVKQDMKLNETNHYNKIVIKEEKREEIDCLAQLSNKLSSEISQFAEVPKASYYTKSISKELNIRSNEMRVIVVEKGDTLSKIAFKAYGNYDAYPKILLANPEVIVNPNQIFVGQHLRIPL